MTVSVLIPYRGSDEWRGNSFEYLIERYRHYFPEFEICVADSENDPFCRSEAKNRAFEVSTGDVLIINDSDTIWEPDCIEEAVRLVQDRNIWVLPFLRYLNISAAGTLQTFKEHPWQVFEEDVLDVDILVDDTNHPPDGSVGGVLVLPRGAFDATNGYDERFQLWGWEDDAFAAALDTLWSNHFRVEGYVAHLWHPTAEDGDFANPDIEKNRALWKEYNKSYGNTTAMQQLVVR